MCEKNKVITKNKMIIISILNQIASDESFFGSVSPRRPKCLKLVDVLYLFRRFFLKNLKLYLICEVTSLIGDCQKGIIYYPLTPREAINHLIAKSYLNTVYKPIYPFDIKATKQDLQPFTFQTIYFQTEKYKLLRNALQLINTIKTVSTRIKRAVIYVINCIQSSEQDKLFENNLTITEK